MRVIAPLLVMTLTDSTHKHIHTHTEEQGFDRVEATGFANRCVGAEPHPTKPMVMMTPIILRPLLGYGLTRMHVTLCGNFRALW
jgi:hypothetical protein